MSTDAPLRDVVAVVRRTASPGREAEFEEAMRSFIAQAAGFPGSLDFRLLRSCGGPREYVVIHRFSDDAARRAFVGSPIRERWMARLRGLTEAEPSIEEFGGLAGWFVPPKAEGRAGPPPRWKMAAVTYLGVFPLTSTIPGWTVRAFPGVHWLLANAVATAAIVAALAWVVMPLLTRVFAPWLSASPTTKDPA